VEAGRPGAHLESISHGPRGDIVSVYTTFPWPGLCCAEMAKLRSEVRKGLVIAGDFRAVATAHRTARNRWRKEATPAGFERSGNTAKTGEDRPSPTENEKADRVPPRLAGPSGSKVARLALVAMNAVRNGDLHRAVEALQAIHDQCVPDGVGGEGEAVTGPGEIG
jgi:hypothetical protein